MRTWFFFVLVACGGGKSSPSPVSNQTPPAAADPAPMIAESSEPSSCLNETKEEEFGKCAINAMDHYSQRMCACKDKACADQVNEALTKFGTELGKSPFAAKDDKPDPDVAKRAADIMTRYSGCMTKLLMDATPPPDPCAGGNPCG